MQFKSVTPIERLKRRTDFVRLTHKGEKHFAHGFVMQVQLLKGEGGLIRLGFTASKKVGGAVERNHAKRRLRAVTDDLMRLNPAFKAPQAADMVLIARSTVLEQDYDALKQDLKGILLKLGCVVE